ncbi:pyridoxine/pyridoxamine 5'-phosphate oxidase-like isoform X1 [Homalodisca vitripennis]|uniref:pyridoxine/pyridoxamine 5'-phosphate oxidase-like isoform X1 n=1 Tax=Homalodisca vitripennis TaxID=197043 RepID=UPI001EEA6559|nr:pyridoxine/pyridoxamine 5'-phosphate oxidase-like isoform X1 [Homalodisca vitripennis]
MLVYAVSLLNKRNPSKTIINTILTFQRRMASNRSTENELKVEDMRTKYHEKNQTFLESDLQSKDPISQFKIWFEEAARTPGIAEANAMCVATASKEGRPSARYLLLKGYGMDGFKFYTHYNSRKGKDLEENPWAALTFYWEPLHRSVRIEGRVEKLGAEDSDNYFHSRPRDSQIGSSASKQSSVIESRDVLTEREAELMAQFKGQEIPRPPTWGGYILIPDSMEFWHGHSNRLHDRIRFRRPESRETPDGKFTHIGENGWVYERLSP